MSTPRLAILILGLVLALAACSPTPRSVVPSSRAVRQPGRACGR